jgi:hypothetical protein
MIAATALAQVKSRLDIDSSVTTFDAAINEFVLSAVNRLYPIAQNEVAAQTKVAGVDGFGELIVDLSTLTTPIIAARKVDASVSGGAYFPATETAHHGTNLTVRELPANQSVTLKIHGLSMFTLATVPVFLEQAVIWYAMSEFYDYLAGNKRKYNVYAQSGARNVDNMRDEAEFFEQKANVYLNDRTTIYGVA